jgi:hypothetical protein
MKQMPKINFDETSKNKSKIVDGKLVVYKDNKHNAPPLKLVKKVYAKIPDDKKVPVVFQTKKSYLKEYIKNQEIERGERFTTQEKKQYIKQELKEMKPIVSRFTTYHNKYIEPRVVFFTDKKVKGKEFEYNVYHEYGHELLEKKPKLQRVWKDTISSNSSPTNYGRLDNDEDFAESYALYKTKNLSDPTRQKIIKDYQGKDRRLNLLQMERLKNVPVGYTEKIISSEKQGIDIVPITEYPKTQLGYETRNRALNVIRAYPNIIGEVEKKDASLVFFPRGKGLKGYGFVPGKYVDLDNKNNQKPIAFSGLLGTEGKGLIPPGEGEYEHQEGGFNMKRKLAGLAFHELMHTRQDIKQKIKELDLPYEKRPHEIEALENEWRKIGEVTPSAETYEEYKNKTPMSDEEFYKRQVEYNKQLKEKKGQGIQLIFGSNGEELKVDTEGKNKIINVDINTLYDMRRKGSYTGDMTPKREPYTMDRIKQGFLKGNIEPIQVTKNEWGSGILQEGKHRLIVAKSLGMKNYPVDIIDDKQSQDMQVYLGKEDDSNYPTRVQYSTFSIGLPPKSIFGVKEGKLYIGNKFKGREFENKEDINELSQAIQHSEIHNVIAEDLQDLDVSRQYDNISNFVEKDNKEKRTRGLYLTKRRLQTIRDNYIPPREDKNAVKIPQQTVSEKHEQDRLIYQVPLISNVAFTQQERDKILREGNIDDIRLYFEGKIPLENIRQDKQSQDMAWSKKSRTPLPDYPESFGFKGEKKLMSPDEFMEITRGEAIQNAVLGGREVPEYAKDLESYREQVIIPSIVTKLKPLVASKTVKVDMPWLEYDRKGLIQGHEGRHRAEAARQLGLTQIPVKIVTKQPEKDWDSENVLNYNKPIAKLTPQEQLDLTKEGIKPVTSIIVENVQDKSFFPDIGLKTHGLPYIREEVDWPEERKKKFTNQFPIVNYVFYTPENKKQALKTVSNNPSKFLEDNNNQIYEKHQRLNQRFGRLYGYSEPEIQEYLEKPINKRYEKQWKEGMKEEEAYRQKKVSLGMQNLFPDDQSQSMVNFPINESEREKARRLRHGRTELANINAAKFRELFEKEHPGTLEWAPDRSRTLAPLTEFDAHPYVYVGERNATLEVEDGRHRINKVANMGQDILVSVRDKETVEKLKRKGVLSDEESRNGGEAYWKVLEDKGITFGEDLSDVDKKQIRTTFEKHPNLLEEYKDTTFDSNKKQEFYDKVADLPKPKIIITPPALGSYEPKSEMEPLRDYYATVATTQSNEKIEQAREELFKQEKLQELSKGYQKQFEVFEEASKVPTTYDIQEKKKKYLQYRLAKKSLPFRYVDYTGKGFSLKKDFSTPVRGGRPYTEEEQQLIKGYGGKITPAGRAMFYTPTPRQIGMMEYQQIQPFGVADKKQMIDLILKYPHIIQEHKKYPITKEVIMEVVRKRPSIIKSIPSDLLTSDILQDLIIEQPNIIEELNYIEAGRYISPDFVRKLKEKKPSVFNNRYAGRFLMDYLSAEDKNDMVRKYPELITYYSGAPEEVYEDVIKKLKYQKDVYKGKGGPSYQAMRKARLEDTYLSTFSNYFRKYGGNKDLDTWTLGVITNPHLVLDSPKEYREKLLPVAIEKEPAIITMYGLAELKSKFGEESARNFWKLALEKNPGMITSYNDATDEDWKEVIKKQPNLIWQYHGADSELWKQAIENDPIVIKKASPNIKYEMWPKVKPLIEKKYGWKTEHIPTEEYNFYDSDLFSLYYFVKNKGGAVHRMDIEKSKLINRPLIKLFLKENTNKIINQNDITEYDNTVVKKNWMTDRREAFVKDYGEKGFWEYKGGQKLLKEPNTVFQYNLPLEQVNRFSEYFNPKHNVNQYIEGSGHPTSPRDLTMTMIRTNLLGDDTLFVEEIQSDLPRHYLGYDTNVFEKTGFEELNETVLKEYPNIKRIIVPTTKYKADKYKVGGTLYPVYDVLPRKLRYKIMQPQEREELFTKYPELKSKEDLWIRDIEKDKQGLNLSKIGSYIDARTPVMDITTENINKVYESTKEPLISMDIDMGGDLQKQHKYEKIPMNKEEIDSMIKEQRKVYEETPITELKKRQETEAKYLKTMSEEEKWQQINQQLELQRQMSPGQAAGFMLNSKMLMHKWNEEIEKRQEIFDKLIRARGSVKDEMKRRLAQPTDVNVNILQDDNSVNKINWKATSKGDKVELMSPEQYLKHTGGLNYWDTDYYDIEEKKFMDISNLAKKMEAGVEIEPLELWNKPSGSSFTTQQQGRHRAYAAKMLDEETVPVIVKRDVESQNKIYPRGKVNPRDDPLGLFEKLNVGVKQEKQYSFNPDDVLPDPENPRFKGRRGPLEEDEVWAPTAFVTKGGVKLPVEFTRFKKRDKLPPQSMVNDLFKGGKIFQSEDEIVQAAYELGATNRQIQVAKQKKRFQHEGVVRDRFSRNVEEGKLGEHIEKFKEERRKKYQKYKEEVDKIPNVSDENKAYTALKVSAEDYQKYNEPVEKNRRLYQMRQLAEERIPELQGKEAEFASTMDFAMGNIIVEQEAKEHLARDLYGEEYYNNLSVPQKRRINYLIRKIAASY